jgi:Sec-independent protein translocase protein TatA/RNA polymerase subunit RPABC4/transcription elongation factor Spt4
MDFFGISFTELLVLAVLAFILFGPEKLPEFAEKAGRLVARLREASSEVTEQYKKPFQEAKESFRSAAFPGPSPSIPAPPRPEPSASEISEETPPLPEGVSFQETSCPQCHHSVNKKFHFCPSCGHNLKEAKESPYFEAWEFPCPQCREQVNRDYIFCPHCGYKLEEPHRAAPKSAEV